MVKPCTRCGNNNEHYVLKTGKCYSWCVLCVKAAHKVQYQKHKPAYQARARNRNRLVKYGVDLVRYNRMFERQKGQCAVCTAPLVVPVIDHCHLTKLVRGILCNNCNAGLGMFKDNPETLLRAVEYLRG